MNSPKVESRKSEVKITGNLRTNDFVFGGGQRSVTFPQINNRQSGSDRQPAGAKIYGQMPSIVCGWPAVHRGQLVFFSLN